MKPIPEGLSQTKVMFNCFNTIEQHNHNSLMWYPQNETATTISFRIPLAFCAFAKNTYSCGIRITIQFEGSQIKTITNKMSSPSTSLYQQTQPSCCDSPRKSITPRMSARSVSFSPDVLVKRTLHINNYSDDEIEATWFGDIDFDRIRKEIAYTVDLMETLKVVDENKYSTRGLEFRTTKGAQHRLRNKLESRNAILDEQDFQWRSGVNSPETLSEVYERSCTKCRVTAHMVGLMDEIMARGIGDAVVPQRKFRKLNESTICRSVQHARRRVC